MKVKYSVIPFIPAALVMIALRALSIFGADESGNFMGMDKMAVAYTVIGIAVGLFIVCIIMNLFDRKTAPVYPVRKNPIAGVLAVMSAAAVICSSVGSLILTTPNAEYYPMSIAIAVFSIPACIAFVLMSRVHFFGKSVVSSSSMLFVFPALWGCSELVYEFLNATKVSISASDLTALFCYIFLTLYFFSHAMVVSRIKGRNPVKACFIYGLPAAAISLSHAVYTFFTGTREGDTLGSALTAVQLVVLSLYALSFIIEMFANSYTKDELEIMDGLPSDDDNEEEKNYKTEGYEDLKSGNATADTDTSEAASDDRPDDYFQAAKKQEIDDFIIGYTAAADDEPIPYFTKGEKEKPVDEGIVIPGVNSRTLDGKPEDYTKHNSKADFDKKDTPSAETVKEEKAESEATSVAPDVKSEAEKAVNDTEAEAAVEQAKEVPETVKEAAEEAKADAPAGDAKPDDDEAPQKTARQKIDDLLKELDSKK